MKNRQYSLLQAPFCFFQVAFSRDVAQNWQKKIFAYFFLLVAYVNIFVAFTSYQQHQSFFKIVKNDYLPELPSLTFTEGRFAKADVDKEIKGSLGSFSIQTQVEKPDSTGHAMTLGREWLTMKNNGQELRVPVELLAVTLQIKEETLSADDLTKRLSKAFKPNFVMQYIVCYIAVALLALAYVLFIALLHFLSRKFLIAKSESKLPLGTLLRLSLSSSVPFFAICSIAFLYGNFNQMTATLASIVHMLFFNVAVSSNLYQAEDEEA